MISSGNLIFESDEEDIGALESMIEAAWPRLLGFTASTIVRSQAQLQSIIDSDPFNGLPHTNHSYQLVTFMKQPVKPAFDFPYQPPGKPYSLVGYSNGIVFSVTDNTVIKTSDLMVWLEKQFGKNITSRTPLTIERILKRMAAGTN